LYLIKDFITPFLPTEHGVMRSWFFCTVCKNVLKGRTTYERNAKNILMSMSTKQVLMKYSRVTRILLCWLER